MTRWEIRSQIIGAAFVLALWPGEVTIPLAILGILGMGMLISFRAAT